MRKATNKKPVKGTKKIDFNQEAIKEFIILGHSIKYNLFLLSKSLIFSKLCEVYKSELTIDQILKLTEQTLENFYKNDHGSKEEESTN